jgi:nitroreductase
LPSRKWPPTLKDMDYFETVEKRRSIRKFTDEKVPTDVIQKALQAAVLAPNSSNTQTWNFFWVRSPENKHKVVEICLSQAAARSAQELIVVTADPSLWRRAHKPLIQFIRSVNAPKPVIQYYEKLIPVTYAWGFLNCFAPIKWLMANAVGLFRPMLRGPNSRRDLQEVAIKSAALAAENFVLAITAQGFSTCMMEGFDAVRMKQLLKLSSAGRLVMVIGVGRESDRGTWGPRFRLPLAQVVKEI